MKKILITTLFASIFFGTTSYAQEEIPGYEKQHQQQKQNAWYAEIGGASLIGLTFNYERYFSKKPGGLSLRVGVGGGPTLDLTESGVYGAAPLGVNYNIPISKDKKHFIETGVCYTFLTGEPGFFSAALGWRYVGKSNTLIRVTVLPLLYLPESKDLYSPWFGFSIGKKF